MSNTLHHKYAVIIIDHLICNQITHLQLFLERCWNTQFTSFRILKSNANMQHVFHSYSTFNILEVVAVAVNFNLGTLPSCLEMP